MDEMMALAGEWGVELPDEALDAVAGGSYDCLGDCLGGAGIECDDAC